MRKSEFGKLLKLAAICHAAEGLNTCLHECASRFGLLLPDGDDRDVLELLHYMAQPGFFMRAFTYDEWLRFEEVWERFHDRLEAYKLLAGAGHLYESSLITS